MKFVVVNLPIRYKHKKYNVGDILEIEENDIKNLSSENLKILESPKNSQKKVDVLVPVSEKDEATEKPSEEVKTPEDNVTDHKENLKEDLKEEKASDEKKEVKKTDDKKTSTDKKKSGGKK